MVRQKNLSEKQKYERQKELARNRKKRQLERMTDEQKEAKKKYDRERMAKLREEKKVKRIGDMTPREQRKMRKYWRERHRVQKIKKQSLENMLEDTPPNSPETRVENESAQRKRGRKQVRKDKAKVYRTVKKQNERIHELEKKIEKYKKRLHREKKKVKVMSTPSPRRQVKEIVGKEKISPNIKKQLFLGLTLKKQLETQLKKVSKTKKNKQIIRKVVGKDVFQKYRVQKYFKNLIPTKKNLASNEASFDYSRNKRKCIQHKLSAELVKFFEDDRVSRMCPGKKDFVKKGNTKKQRRVLLDTIENLHKKFLAENTDSKISRSTFFRARPFWVTFPKMSDRETCACIKHSNMQLLVSALKNTNVIQERNPNELIKSVVCSTENERCMLGQCKDCKNKTIELKSHDDFTVKFFKWVTVEEKRKIKDKVRLIKKTIKSTERKRITQMKSYLKKELDAFKKHTYYDKHQSSTLRTVIDSIKTGTLVFRIDFSENYVAKFASEVQSVHFGASKKQISLHTGVRYASVDNSKVDPLCFATASDNLDHQAHAVWAHMRPVLERSANEFPNTHTVHIFSDSPSSQYRNRNNMYLMNNMMPEFFPKLKVLTWNFSEAGHGKGPMDGVGGTLKRGADQKVLCGNDITCAAEFLIALKDFNILMFEIPVADIERLKTVLTDVKVPPIKGVMQVHQVTWYKGGSMYTRTLSCFDCPASEKCDHYHFSKINLVVDVVSSKSQGDIHPPPKTKLSVEDVYSSSDEDDDVRSQASPDLTSGPQDLVSMYAGNVCGPILKNELVSDVHVIVEYPVKKGKKFENKQYLGICQGGVINNEVEVLFLKNCEKENTLFFANDKDQPSVPVSQIKAIVPTPTMILKGDRVFYKFKKVV